MINNDDNDDDDEDDDFGFENVGVDTWLSWMQFILQKKKESTYTTIYNIYFMWG